eukprot:747913-Hanusia_phi.AAC.2
MEIDLTCRQVCARDSRWCLRAVRSERKSEKLLLTEEQKAITCHQASETVYTCTFKDVTIQAVEISLKQIQSRSGRRVNAITAETTFRIGAKQQNSNNKLLPRRYIDIAETDGHMIKKTPSAKQVSTIWSSFTPDEQVEGTSPCPTCLKKIQIIRFSKSSNRAQHIVGILFFTKRVNEVFPAALFSMLDFTIVAYQQEGRRKIASNGDHEHGT